MKSRTEGILTFLKVLAYIVMVGYCIQCGSQIITFIVSFFNPVAARDIPGASYSLFELQQQSWWHYVGVMSFTIALSAMHSFVWYRIIQLLSSLNLRNPFSRKVAGLLEKTGLQLLTIWILSIIADRSTQAIALDTGLPVGNVPALNEYLFIAGIVYIISQVFKRGIELQEENELTV